MDQYQGGFSFQVYSPQGTKPLDPLKVVGNVKKEYDKTCRSQVIVIEQSSTGSKVTMPKMPSRSLLVQPVVVFQLCTMLASPLSAEIVVVDGLGKRRLMFSSNFNDVQVHPQHVKIPIRLPPSCWMTLCIDVRSLYSSIYDKKAAVGLKGIESITVGSSCRLRKIFTLKDLPQANGEIPSTLDFPAGFESPLVTFSSVDDFVSELEATPQRGTPGLKKPITPASGTPLVHKSPPPSSAPSGAKRVVEKTPLDQPRNVLLDASDLSSQARPTQPSAQKSAGSKQLLGNTPVRPSRVQSAPMGSSVKKHMDFSDIDSQIESIRESLVMANQTKASHYSANAELQMSHHRTFLGESNDGSAVASSRQSQSPAKSSTSTTASMQRRPANPMGKKFNSSASSVTTSSQFSFVSPSAVQSQNASIVESINVSSVIDQHPSVKPDGRCITVDELLEQEQQEVPETFVGRSGLVGKSTATIGDASSIADYCSSVPFDDSAIFKELHRPDSRRQPVRESDAVVSESLLAALEHITSRKPSHQTAGRGDVMEVDADEDEDSFVVHRPADFYKGFDLTGYDSMISAGEESVHIVEVPPSESGGPLNQYAANEQRFHPQNLRADRGSVHSSQHQQRPPTHGRSTTTSASAGTLMSARGGFEIPGEEQHASRERLQSRPLPPVPMAAPTVSGSRAVSRDGPVRYAQVPRPTSSGGIARNLGSRSGRPPTQQRLAGGNLGSGPVVVPQSTSHSQEHKAIIDINVDPNASVVMHSLGHVPTNPPTVERYGVLSDQSMDDDPVVSSATLTDDVPSTSSLLPPLDEAQLSSETAGNDHTSGMVGSSPESVSPDRFEYDPILKCYFDRMTNQYASAKQYE